VFYDPRRVLQWDIGSHSTLIDFYHQVQTSIQHHLYIFHLQEDVSICIFQYVLQVHSFGWRSRDKTRKCTRFCYETLLEKVKNTMSLLYYFLFLRSQQF
jgi:hypothetical protein